MGDWNEAEGDARKVAIHEQYFPESLSDDPKWTEAERVHDWRNHVGERTKGIWPTLTREQRIAVYLDADERASDESWD